jgi:hypothetical protein
MKATQHAKERSNDRVGMKEQEGKKGQKGNKRVRTTRL